MRIDCPICGTRDMREFYYQGAAIALARPAPDAAAAEWDDYLHLRDNPASWHQELWHHESGCGSWIQVERNTATHEIRNVTLAGQTE